MKDLLRTFWPCGNLSQVKNQYSNSIHWSIHEKKIKFSFFRDLNLSYLVPMKITQWFKMFCLCLPTAKRNLVVLVCWAPLFSCYTKPVYVDWASEHIYTASKINEMIFSMKMGQECSQCASVFVFERAGQITGGWCRAVLTAPCWTGNFSGLRWRSKALIWKYSCQPKASWNDNN